MRQATLLIAFIKFSILRALDQSADGERTLILHIPKSGGSTLCNALRRAERDISNSTVSSGERTNCWEPYDGPLWCCPNIVSIEERTCQQRRMYNHQYAMIERHMDTDSKTGEVLLCAGVKYVAILREPVSRAVSHVHHFVSVLPRIRDWLFRTPSPVVCRFFDHLDRISPYSDESGSLVKTVFGTNMKTNFKSLEKDFYSINSFTSNYITRMVLGKSIGADDFTLSRHAINAPELKKALNVLVRFDAVFKLESLDQQGPSLQRFLGIAVSDIEHVGHRVAKHDILYRLLETNYSRWLRKRNHWDVSLSEALFDGTAL